MTRGNVQPARNEAASSAHGAAMAAIKRDISALTGKIHKPTRKLLSSNGFLVFGVKTQP